MTSKFRTSENGDPNYFEFYEQSTSEYENSSESNGSDTEASSEYEMSETSEDRAFVVPDSEATSYVASIGSSNGSNPFMSEGSRDSDIDEEPPALAEKYPVRTMAERSIYRKGEHVKQRLVLWYSWEDQEAW